MIQNMGTWKRHPDPDEECDTFLAGDPQGTCIGDGHHLCVGCKLLRPDFGGPNGYDRRELYLSLGIESTSGLRVFIIEPITNRT